MKILYPAAYFQPENTALLRLEKDLLQALTGAGHTVETVCPIPSRGISSDTRRKYQKVREETLYDGRVHVRRFWAPSEGKNPVLRAFRYFWCNFRTYQIGKKVRGADLIFSWSTPPTQGLLAGFLKKKLKCPVIYSLQDVFPDTLVIAGLAKRDSILWKIGRKMEDAAYRRADRIVVISRDFQRNIMEKGVSAEKISLIYNWINEQEVYAVPREENPLYDEYGLPRDKFYVAYSGNIGHSQNMDILLDAARSLRDTREDIGFIIVGEGACRGHVEERIQSEGLRNVALLPFQPYEKISQVFSLGDVGLLISKKGTSSHSVPVKTWSYLSARRPVLASFDLDSELCRLLPEHGCGVCIEPDNAAALRDAVLRLAGERDKLPGMGERGREFILQELTAGASMSKWLELMERVGNGDGNR